MDTRLTRFVLDTRLACIGDPAYIRDPASIRTNCLDSRLVLGTQLLYETRLVLEVLRYSVSKNCAKLFFFGTLSNFHQL